MRISRFVRVISMAVLGALVSLVLVRSYDGYRHSQERGRLVAHIVEEQIRQLSQEPALEAPIADARYWPDDFQALRDWVVVKSFQTDDPALVLGRLHALSGGHELASGLKVSLSRWYDTLSRWSEERHLADVGPDSALQHGREHFFEAEGYQRIGHRFDATIAYLWSISDLVAFIQRNPLHGDVAEALFLTGSAYLQLRDALPSTVRSDRLINLCSELYPGTLWSDLASTVRRFKAGHEG